MTQKGDAIAEFLAAPSNAGSRDQLPAGHRRRTCGKLANTMSASPTPRHPNAITPATLVRVVGNVANHSSGVGEVRTTVLSRTQ